MKNRLLVIIGITMFVTSSSITIPNQVNALQCMISPFSESFERYDLLLHGTLVEKQTSNQLGLNGALTTLTFDTITVYKGEYRDTFVITADLTWDDFYRENGDYVLFADKDGDNYLRDVCVPNYVVTKDIIDFLDDYMINPLIGVGVNELYDVVGMFEKRSLEIKRQNYVDLNRGENLLERIRQEGLKNNISCDFEKEFANLSEHLSDNGILNRFIEENPDYEEIGGSIILNTNPQIAKITYVGKTEILEISIMNAEIIDNCFFVYNQKIIDKNTNEIQRNHDTQEKICLAENSHKLFPDFCPNIKKELPDFIQSDSYTASYAQQWILKIILIVIILFGVSVGVIIGIKIWRKTK